MMKAKKAHRHQKLIPRTYRIRAMVGSIGMSKFEQLRSFFLYIFSLIIDFLPSYFHMECLLQKR